MHKIHAKHLLVSFLTPQSRSMGRCLHCMGLLLNIGLCMTCTNVKMYQFSRFANLPRFVNCVEVGHYLKFCNYKIILDLSRLMGKPTICICENKDADQLRGNREADQRLCFRYSDSTIPLLLKSEISSF